MYIHNIKIKIMACKLLNCLKYKIAEKNTDAIIKKMISNLIFLYLYDIEYIVPDKPKTNPILAILEPIILPVTKPILP